MFDVRCTMFDVHQYSVRSAGGGQVPARLTVYGIYDWRVRRSLVTSRHRLNFFYWIFSGGGKKSHNHTRWQIDGKSTSASGIAVHGYPALMCLDDMLDNSQTQSSSAQAAAARFIDTVKAFE